jgi:hypothetical protein
MTQVRWLDPDTAAAYLKVGPEDLRRLVREGRIPPAFRQLSPRRPRWDRIALNVALASEIPSSALNSADAAVEAMRAGYALPTSRRARS